MSFIYESQVHKCPYCNSEIPHILTVASENKVVFSRELFWKENSSISNEILIPERIFLPFDSKFNSLPVLFLSAIENQIEIILTIKKPENYFFANNLKLEISQNGEKNQLFGSLSVKLKKGESFSIIAKFKDCSEKSLMFKLEF